VRYYEPSSGRYLQTDPLGLGGGLSRYAYAGGNPLIYSDPLGLLSNKSYWVEVGLGLAGGTIIGFGMLIEAPVIIVGGVVFEVGAGVYAGYEAYARVKEAMAVKKENEDKALNPDSGSGGGSCSSK
jgi:uncharacterized protein RhaS with RHS repeats